MVVGWWYLGGVPPPISHAAALGVWMASGAVGVAGGDVHDAHESGRKAEDEEEERKQEGGEGGRAVAHHRSNSGFSSRSMRKDVL